MPLIQSRGVTVRFVNRTGVKEAQKNFDDRMNVPGKLMELHQTLSAIGANKSVTAPNDMYFDLKKNETAMAPDWIETDWNFHAQKVAALNGGLGIIEIAAQQPADVRASAAMVPTGTPPPPEASLYDGKTQITPSAALQGLPEEPQKRQSRSSRN